MIGVYELVVLSPAFAGTAVAIAAVTSMGCHVRRHAARARHHKRRNGGL